MKIRSHSKCRLNPLSLLALLLAAFLASTNTFAVAGFSRQTGMSCNQCHTSHAAATPNFTFSGKKFKGLGYRVPTVQVPDIEKGEPEDRGEYLLLNPVQWSARFQFSALNNVKLPAGPEAGEWGEAQTNPTARLAIFPFIGPLNKHLGIWTEFYVVATGSENEEWGTAHASYEEFDLRYTINPDSDANVYGLSLNNQGPAEIFGFGPWPAVGLHSGVSNRGGINGWQHPNFANVMAYGWMNDRWVWALGGNTGDTNNGWDDSNLTGMFGYAFENSYSNELWANVYFRAGEDAMPLVTDISVPADRHDFHYSEDVAGIGATRGPDCPSPSDFILDGCPYLAEDLDDHTAVEADLRWSRQDFGDLSFEVVGRLGFNDEDYIDGAETRMNTWGIATQFGWKHTYYIKPYVNGHLDFEFTDRNGTEYDIDTSLNYGIWLAYKPVENFLLSLGYHSLQALSLENSALDDGARYDLAASISF